MKLKDINYAPLKEMNAAWPRAIVEFFKPWLIVSSIVLIGVIAGLMASFDTDFGLINVIIIGAVVGAGFVTKKVVEQKDKVWGRFGEVNGWPVTPGSQASLLYVPPVLQEAGNHRRLGDIVHADIDGHQCSVYMYQFTTGSGKSKRTHYYTIARVEIARPFPHLILDSKGSMAIVRGPQMSKVKLEGNFNEYFSLYHDKGKHIDALSVITPDVMRTLIDSNQAQDIEIADKSVYFMCHTDKRTADGLPDLLASVDALSDELSHKAKTIQYKSAPNQVHLTQIAADYFKSGDRVMSSLGWIIIGMFLVPALVMIIVGIMASAAGQ